MISNKFMVFYLNMIIRYSKKALISVITIVADFFPTKRHRLSEKELIFIAGVEGSGTTLLNKLLSEPQNAMSITHHDYLPAQPVRMPDRIARRAKVSPIRNLQNLATVRKFNRLVNKLWQFPYSNNENIKSLTLVRLRNLTIPASISKIVIKRSYPSGRQGIILPNLADLFSICKKVKIICVKRNLQENASSVFRRGFVNTIEDAIERVKHADRVLKWQLDSLEGTEVLTVTYEDLVENKYRTLARLEGFLGYQPGELQQLSFWISRRSTDSRSVF